MAAAESLASINALSTDVVAKILGYLGGPEEIMLSRRVCKKIRDAATIAIVPSTDFRVDSERRYNLIVAMRRAIPNPQSMNTYDEVARVLPNLQRVSIFSLGTRQKFEDGLDPDKDQATKTRRYWKAHDIRVLSSFKKLRVLSLYCAPLNGTYPLLFNFPLLVSLSISHCKYLKWDLRMLERLTILKHLHVENNQYVTGNISSLRMLKGSLESLEISNCLNVVGNFMDIADFSRLDYLRLEGSAVTGDVRDITVNDFRGLNHLYLPSTVYGGVGYEFGSISEVPAFMNSIYRLQKRTPSLFDQCVWYLSHSSPDSYVSLSFAETYLPPAPLEFTFIRAGPRLGWRWTQCEVNWLDPEPDRRSSEYGRYTKELRRIQRNAMFYSGYWEPPTEEEYWRLCSRYRANLFDFY